MAPSHSKIGNTVDLIPANRRAGSPPAPREEAQMGDPAFDVGYFVAQTKMTHGLGDATVRAVEGFIQEYQENQPGIDPDLAQRAAVFEAQTYLQRIYHTYYLLALRPDFDLISEWLNECQDCLRKTQSSRPETGRRNQ